MILVRNIRLPLSAAEPQAFEKALHTPEDLDENIFDYIRKSASFAYARNHEYIEVKIYMDET